MFEKNSQEWSQNIHEVVRKTLDLYYMQ